MSITSFFNDLGQTLSTGISDSDYNRQLEREKQAMNLAKDEQEFVMSQVAFYAAIAGVLILVLVVAYKKI